MPSDNTIRPYPSAEVLVRNKVASRLHAKDDSLYDYSQEAQESARGFTGWVDLASNPPVLPQRADHFARRMHEEAGFDTFLLLGEGGSTQAPMAISKFNKGNPGAFKFRVMDSDSPVRVREQLSECNLATTLACVSSKSGGTIEPRSLLTVVRGAFADQLGPERAVRHLMAITDPGSPLDAQAREEGWLAIFHGEPTVGGRFSALSVFGLVPAALAGVDAGKFAERARHAENRCSVDGPGNPAIVLAAFLYDNYLEGRDKVAFLVPKRGRALGLWVEQLVAESLGKGGKGILPYIEVDPLLIAEDRGDRVAVAYEIASDPEDERDNFAKSIERVSAGIPRLQFSLDGVCDLAEQFVVWEYAIAMCGYLMKVAPFDQPDVQSAKTATLDVLRDGHVEPDFTQSTIDGAEVGVVEVRLGEALKGAISFEDALERLAGGIEPGDYFALNAFLPFTGEGRREALEVARHAVAEETGAVSCLEVGPRYLHSTGQLQKGGPDKGVFLIVSADEAHDIPLEGVPAPSLAALAKAQAEGDFAILSARGRRCMHVHLPDNSASTLRLLANAVRDAARKAAAAS